MAEPIVTRTKIHEEQVDPNLNAEKLGERKMSKEEVRVEKKWKFNWRAIFVAFAIFLIAGVLVMGARGFNKLFKGDGTNTVKDVRVTTDPNLRSQVSDNELKPGEQVASSYNTVTQQAEGQVRGATVTETRVAPAAGARPRSYPDPLYPESTLYNTTPYDYTYPAQYSYPTTQRYYYPPMEYERPPCDWLGDRYACLEPAPQDFPMTSNTPYWASRGMYYNQYYAPVYQRYPSYPMY